MKYFIPFFLFIVLKTFATPIPSKLKLKAASAKEFAVAKGFNSDIVFLVDFSINSASYRFFVVDVNKDSILDKGLVTHGHCHTGLDKVKFSNQPGCACSSEGRYKIGKSYHGNFGLAYKLQGLDATNNNAEKRYVVIHSHSCVPDIETEDAICQSEGCTTVSPGFLKRLQKRIDVSKKPVLMWVFG